jgi:serine phosphatase RsbU (regulator of sigma subunit)
MRFTRLSIFLFLFSLTHGMLSAQQIFLIDSVGEKGRPIETKWFFKQSDDPHDKDRGIDDSKWQLLDPQLDDEEEIRVFGKMGCFRLHFRVDSSLKNIPLSFTISHKGASEIYLDGEKIGSFGTPNWNEEHEITEDPLDLPVPFNYKPGEEHVITLFYSNHNTENAYSDSGKKMAGFEISVGPSQYATAYVLYVQALSIGIGFTLACFYLVLGLVHLLIWFFYKSNKGNLYYFLFAANLAIFPLCISLAVNTSNTTTGHILLLIAVLAFPLTFISLLNLVYHFFYEKFPKRFKWYFLAGVVSAIWNFFQLPYYEILYISFPITATIDTLFTVIAAVRKRKRGSKIIGAGILFFAGFILFALVSIIIAGFMTSSINLGDSSWGMLVLVLFILSIISIPVSMSVFLAREFAQTNNSLKQKLDEVEVLSAKSIEQEKEKQKILETEKERLEEQVEERTSEITEQKKVIEEKNKDITDSILYAKKIQDAMLPATDVIKQLFPASFILFKPKDIVSGDFYWLSELHTLNSRQLFIAAADCTGHGVPGALMSMTGNNFLNQLVNERTISSTKEILTHLDESIRKSLKQERADVESKDGMDIALCRFNADFSEVLYSGANRPLWILRNGELLEYKAGKKSIGGARSDNEPAYSEQLISLQKNDCVYIFSDGYADQFGGPEGKKFMTKQFKKIISSFGAMDMNAQKEKLDEAFLNWKKDLGQVDDVLVIGIKVI